jgi:hypothetical protein
MVIIRKLSKMDFNETISTAGKLGVTAEEVWAIVTTTPPNCEERTETFANGNILTLRGDS